MESKQKTILLVEDQIVAAAPVINILKNSGYNPIYVMRGEDAVNIIETGTLIDVIVMDIDLGPGICGITAFEQINSIRQLPVLFFTSHPEEIIKERTGEIHYLNYLSKKSALASLVMSIEKTFFSFNFLHEISTEFHDIKPSLINIPQKD